MNPKDDPVVDAILLIFGSMGLGMLIMFFIIFIHECGGV